MSEPMTYLRRGRITFIEEMLRYVPGALYTIRNMLGIDPSGGGVPDATETVKGKAELATVEEAVDGTDETRIVTPAGLAAAIAAIPQSSGVAFPLRYSTVAELTTPAAMFSSIVNALFAASDGTFSYPPDADCYTTFCFHIGGNTNAFFLSRLGTSGTPEFTYPYITGGVTDFVSGPSMPISIPATTLITVWGVMHTPLVGP